MNTGVFLNGVRQMQAKLKSLPEEKEKAILRALRTEAEVEMTESKKRCPVDTGVLRASGHVQPAEVHGKVFSVTMGYGGAASAYAVRQHEELDYHHEVGQAKFLESVLMESVPYMAERIAARIREGS